MARKRKQRSKGQGSLFKRDEQGPWIASWIDHRGKRRERSTKTTDKAAAERILNKIIADEALRKEGVVDASTDRYAASMRRPLAEHLADWERDLLAKGRSGKHVTLVYKRATALLEMIKAQTMSDITASAIQAALGRLHEEGKSLQTCQHYLRAIKQFSRWLRADGRIREDVLAHLSGYNTSTDRRRERRALTAEEIDWLIKVTESSPPHRSMTGPDRAMLYRVALGTGFRVSELRSLTPASFRLDDDPPSIALQASHSKRRRDDLQPIRIDLAELLRSWLAGKSDQSVVFQPMPEKTGLMIQADLRRSRARWIRSVVDRKERRKRRSSDFLSVVDDSGQIVDFHALRVTYITLLVKGGASVKVAQELARHSTPILTMNVYSKLGVHDLAGALDYLPGQERPGTNFEVAAVLKTGTDDEPVDVDDDPPLYPPQLANESEPADAERCEHSTELPRKETVHKSLPKDELCGPVRREATTIRKATGRTRTDDLRFTKPLLCQLSYGGKSPASNCLRRSCSAASIPMARTAS